MTLLIGRPVVTAAAGTTTAGEGSGSGPAPWQPRVSAYRASAIAVMMTVTMAALVIAVPFTAGPMRYLCLLVPVLIAGSLSRRSTAEYLEFSLWIWVLYPGLRRIIEWRTGYDPNTLVLVAPLAVSALSLPILVRYPLAGHRAVVRLMLRTFVLLVYSTAVAVILLRSPLSVGLGFLQIAVPLSLGLMALVAVRFRDLANVLTRFSTGSLLVTGVYGIYQFIVAPKWDVEWLRNVSRVVSSFGQAKPFEIRVFSTVNDPGTLSMVLVFGLLWLLSRRRISPFQVAALVVGGSCLSLTLVRSGWIALALGIVLAVLRGWIKPERLLALTVGIVFVASLSAAAVAPVIQRFDSSKTAGSGDASLQARVSFQSREFLPALTNLTGNGVGSAGTAVRRDDSGDTQRFADTDSGFLETILVFGGPLGLVLLVGTLVAGWKVFLRPSRLSRGAACYAMTLPVQLFFGSVYGDLIAVLAWMSLVAASRQEQPPVPKPEPAATSEEMA